MKKLFCTLIVATIISACSDQAPTVIQSNDTQTIEIKGNDNNAHQGIEWFDGHLEEAFAHAKSENKPLFLYWGAEWCPPCNELKATIFKRTDFIEKTKLFVPLFLDGDTDSAQKYGEQFGVMGYPTLIIFNPQGKEITRIPGGLELERYVSVLNLTLTTIKPVSDLLAGALQGASLSNDDFSLLAFYSWGQDNGRVLKNTDNTEVDTIAIFKTLIDITPSQLEIERSRFVTLYLEYLAQAVLQEENPLVLESEVVVEAKLLLSSFLSSPSQVSANLSFLNYDGGDVLNAIYQPGKERDVVVGLWRQHLQKHSNNEILSISERVDTVFAQIWLSKLDDQEAILSDELKTRVVEMAEWADKSAKTNYQRQAVINSVYSLLVDAGMSDKAEILLTAELSKSKSPYYWMLDLAELSKEAGRIDDAIRWLEKAYRESKGNATRFQWGVNYVVGILDMTPENEILIEQSAAEILQELSLQKDPVHGRNSKRITRLGKELKSWNSITSRQIIVDKLVKSYADICNNMKLEAEDLDTCLAKFIQG